MSLLIGIAQYVRIEICMLISNYAGGIALIAVPPANFQRILKAPIGYVCYLMYNIL